jgi:hypothetical protein
MTTTEKPCAELMQRREIEQEAKEWPSDERINRIGQNGGEALHYDKVADSGVYEA